MKVRNLVLGLMLAANVLTAHSAVLTTGGAASMPAASMSAASTTVASTVTTNMMNVQNSVIVECDLEIEHVKKDGEWIGSYVPSLKETIKNSRCQWNKETMEELNGTHYKFGKVKGIFSVKDATRVMIELVEVNE